MKYEIGDTVLVLHTGEQGRVVDIISEQMVMIDVDGVSFPVYNDQIDFPYFRMFSEKKTPEKKKLHLDQLPKEKQSTQPAGPPGVFLSLVPVYARDIFEDEVVDHFKIYLVNRTPCGYLFTFKASAGAMAGHTVSHELGSGADFYLQDIPFNEAAANPRFDFEFRLNEPDKKKPPYFEVPFRVRPKQLYNKMAEMKAANEALFHFLLFEEYPSLPPAGKLDDLPDAPSPAGYALDASTRFRDATPDVIDLHIEKITDSWKHLTPFEMLTLQLDTFEHHFAMAKAQYLPVLTVIHGVGSGRLKEEIHRLLKGRPGVASFSDEYQPRYGYGATVILFVY